MVSRHHNTLYLILLSGIGTYKYIELKEIINEYTCKFFDVETWCKNKSAKHVHPIICGGTRVHIRKLSTFIYIIYIRIWVHWIQFIKANINWIITNISRIFGTRYPRQDVARLNHKFSMLYIKYIDTWKSCIK